MLNIVLYTHTFLPKIGGREIVVDQLALALVARGHKVSVVGPQGFLSNFKQDSNQAAGERHQELKVRRYPRLSLRRPFIDPAERILQEHQMRIQLLLDLATHRCDIIHAHTLYPAGYIASAAGLLGVKAPLVCTPHGIDINTAPDQGYGMRLDPVLNKKINLALDRCSAVTAISAGIEQELRNAGVSRDKVHFIGNGVDLARFEGPAKSDIRGHYKLPENGKLILTVGNYTPLKGHEDLIRLMPNVMQRVPEAHLLIVGAGTDHLKDLAQELGVVSNVHILGTIAPPAQSGPAAGNGPDPLADLYKESALYISASNREGAEGLSLSLLDAMATGLPLVGTDIVGNRDVIANDQTGYLVPLDSPDAMSDSICRVLESDEVAQKLSRGSRAAGEMFSWDAIAAQYEALYMKLLSQSGESNTHPSMGQQ